MLIVAVLAYTHIPSLLSEYGHTDDYNFLHNYSNHDFHILNNDITAMGRPLFSIVCKLLITGFDHTADLALLRMLSILGIFLCACRFYRFIARYGYTSLIRITSSIVLFSSLPFIVYNGWSISFPFPYAFLLAFIAGEQLVTVDRPGLRHYFVSSLLLLVSLFTYQPTAMGFLLPVLVSVTATRDMRYPQYAAIACFLIVLAGYMLVYRGIILENFPRNWATDRGSYPADIMGKLVYLVQTPLRDVFSWHAVLATDRRFPVWLVSLAIAAFGASMVIIQAERNARRGLALAIPALIGLAFIPVAVVKHDSAPFRMLAGPTCLVLWLMLCALTPWQRHGSIARIAGVGAFVFAAIAACMGRHALVEGIVKPQAHELAAYRAAIQNIGTDVPRTVVFIHPLEPTQVPETRRYHEFGIISSMLAWVPGPMLFLLFHERFPDLSAYQFQVIQTHAWDFIDAGGLPLVHGHTILTGAPLPERASMDPGSSTEAKLTEIEIQPLGMVTVYNNDWVYHPVFGYIRLRPFPTVDSAGEPPGKTTGINMLIGRENAWYWTSAEAFPYFLHYATNTWKLYHPESIPYWDN
jgi:hypothetical protein